MLFLWRGFGCLSCGIFFVCICIIIMVKAYTVIVASLVWVVLVGDTLLARWLSLFGFYFKSTHFLLCGCELLLAFLLFAGCFSFDFQSHHNSRYLPWPYFYATNDDDDVHCHLLLLFIHIFHLFVDWLDNLDNGWVKCDVGREVCWLWCSGSGVHDGEECDCFLYSKLLWWYQRWWYVDVPSFWSHHNLRHLPLAIFLCN